MAKIALINLANVNADALSGIAEQADLPPGEIRLIVGDSLIGGQFQGFTIARPFAALADDLCGLDEHMDTAWDCGVVIGHTWAARQAEFPAYFAYLLGHEFGHATTVLTSLALAVYEDIVLRYLPKAAPHHKWRWDEMPHEVRYDQFGMAISESLYGRSTIDAEFRQIVADGLTKDESRLNKALCLIPTTDLRGIWQELASFAQPYRESLLRLWDDDIQTGRLQIATHLSKLDSLWSAS